MRNLKILVILVVVLITGCKNYESEIVDVSNQLIEIQEQYINDNKILVERVDEIDSRIQGLHDQLSELASNVSQIESEVEGIDLELIEQSISVIESDVDFIEELIWRDNLFDAEMIEVGDYVGQMKLIDISEWKGPVLQFSGETYVRGRVGIIEDNPVTVEGVAFYVDDLSGYLPRERSDYRTLWFMFSNQDEAMELLKDYDTNEEVTIIINDYKVDLTQSAVVNSARLIRVIP